MERGGGPGILNGSSCGGGLGQTRDPDRTDPRSRGGQPIERRFDGSRRLWIDLGKWLPFEPADTEADRP